MSIWSFLIPKMTFLSVFASNNFILIVLSQKYVDLISFGSKNNVFISLAPARKAPGAFWTPGFWHCAVKWHLRADARNCAQMLCIGPIFDFVKALKRSRRSKNTKTKFIILAEFGETPRFWDLFYFRYFSFCAPFILVVVVLILGRWTINPRIGKSCYWE